MKALNAAAALIAIAIALLPGHPALAEPETAAGAEPLDLRIEQQMAQAGIVGLAAAIIVDRKVAWMKGFGFADRARATPFTPDTVMNIASISKTVTGVALMRAVQDGKLDLDRDINAYLPFPVVNPHVPDAKITLRHLATHTSGIIDRQSVYEASYHQGGDAPQPLAAFLRSYLTAGEPLYAEANFLPAAPGRMRDYSNIGAGLAGHIVEIAVGERLDAYTRRHIFEPLRMDNSGWFLADMAPAKHSTLYAARDGEATPIPLYGLTTYPDGGVRTSVADLSRFFIALLGDGEFEGTRILGRESAQEMLRFQYTADDKPDNVNIAGEDSVNSGIFWSSKFDLARIGHSGSDPGVTTMMLADPARTVGVVLFINTSLTGRDNRFPGQIFDALWAHAEMLKAGAGPADGD